VQSFFPLFTVQILLVTGKGAAAPPGPEARHGVTPPMRDARARHFRPRPDVDPALVAKTEQDLLAVLGVNTSAYDFGAEKHLRCDPTMGQHHL